MATDYQGRDTDAATAANVASKTTSFDSIISQMGEPDAVSGSDKDVTFEPDSAELAKLLGAQRDEIKENLNLYSSLLDWYSHKNLAKYLKKHHREGATLFKNRKDKQFVYNYIPGIIDTYIGFIFKKGVRRSAIRDAAVESQLDSLKIKLAQALESKYAALQQSFSASPPPATPAAAPDATASGAAPSREPAQADVPQGGNDLAMQMQMEFLQQVMLEKQKIMGASTPADLTAFWKDCDRAGTTLTDFMRKVGTLAQLFGWIPVVIDLPSKDDMGISDFPKTEKDRQKVGYRPYCSFFLPIHVMDWETNRKGDLQWIRFKEQAPDGKGPFQKQKGDKSAYYRTFTTNAWYLHKVDKNVATLISSGEHNLGRVPVTIVYNTRALMDELIGVSAVRDVLEINIAILNYISLMNEDIYQKCLSILVMKSSDDETKTIEIGENNILAYTGEQPPQFITPSTAPGEFIASQIMAAKEEITDIARRGGGSSTGPVKPIIGYSKEFQEANVALSNKADHLEQAEFAIHSIFYAYFGREFIGEIDYPDDFDITSLVSVMDEVWKAKGIVRSDTFKRELEKKIVHDVLPKLSKQTADRIGLEIDLGTAEQGFFYPMGGGQQ